MVNINSNLENLKDVTMNFRAPKRLYIYQAPIIK